MTGPAADHRVWDDVQRPLTRHRSPSGLAGSNLQVSRMGENITDARKKGNYPLRFEIQSLVNRKFHQTCTVGIVWP